MKRCQRSISNFGKVIITFCLLVKHLWWHSLLCFKMGLSYIWFFLLGKALGHMQGHAVKLFWQTRYVSKHLKYICSVSKLTSNKEKRQIWVEKIIRSLPTFPLTILEQFPFWKDWNLKLRKQSQARLLKRLRKKVEEFWEQGGRKGLCICGSSYKTPVRQDRLLWSNFPHVQAGLQLLSSHDWPTPDC